MALDLWFREDVTRILAATYETFRASSAAYRPSSGVEMAPYEQGFVDALRAVAVAFGVGPEGGRRHEAGWRPEDRRCLYPGWGVGA